MFYTNYDITKQAQILLPPTERKLNKLRILRAFLYPQNFVFNIWLNQYVKYDNSVPNWEDTPKPAFNIGSVAEYKYQKYISLINSNTQDITNKNYWLKVSNFFCGYQYLSASKPNILFHEFLLNLNFRLPFLGAALVGASDLNTIKISFNTYQTGTYNIGVARGTAIGSVYSGEYLPSNSVLNNRSLFNYTIFIKQTQGVRTPTIEQVRAFYELIRPAFAIVDYNYI